MDESQPLLGHIVEEHQHHVPDQQLIDFDPKGDTENPLDWPKAYKNVVVFLLAFMAFTVTFTCIGVVPVADQITHELDGRESKSASVLLVTVWELGEAAGPLLIAPLSEIYGRYAVFNVANIIFIFGVILSALSQTTKVFIFARFLTGLAVASNVLNPAIIGDIFPSQQRGSGMSMVMFAPLLGGAIGPAINGAIAETLGWRKILWLAAIVAIVCEVAFFTLLRETYKVPILQRRAARLRKEYNDDSLRCPFEKDHGGSTVGWAELRTAIKRPFLVIADSTVLQILSFYGTLVFSFYYIVATSLPGMLREIYGFSPAQIGSSFLAFSTGSVCGVVLCNASVDSIYVRLGKPRGGVSIPEYRLPVMIAASILFPSVVALYGWTAHAHWPVAVLLVSLGLFGFSLVSIWVPLSSYVVDAFGLYSASALTMVLISRCLGSTLIPLAIPVLTESVGLGYSYVIQAAVMAAMIPLPIAVMTYGNRWRNTSVYTKNDQS